MLLDCGWAYGVCVFPFVAEITHSGLPATEKLVDYLVNRLRKSEYNIKEKTLLVIKVWLQEIVMLCWSARNCGLRWLAECGQDRQARVS